MIGRVVLSVVLDLVVYDGEWDRIHLPPDVLCLVVGEKMASHSFKWLQLLLPTGQLVWLYEQEVKERHVVVV